MYASASDGDGQEEKPTFRVCLMDDEAEIGASLADVTRPMFVSTALSSHYGHARWSGGCGGGRFLSPISVTRPNKTSK